MPGMLPLRDMHLRHRALTEPVAGSHCEAAAVCLSRHHFPPAGFALEGDGVSRRVDVEWEVADTRTRDAWDNKVDVTEAGACACVIAGVELLHGLFAVRRAHTGTGADYYVGPAGAGVDDLEDCWRLEVSGVDAGDKKAVLRRLIQKAQQAREGDSDLPAFAGVIGFAAKLIVIERVNVT